MVNKPGRMVVREAIARGTDPDTGVALLQMTSMPAIHTNIYGEVPYMDASSRWLMLTRSERSYGPCAIWRFDLERRWLTPVCEPVDDIRGVAVSPDQRHFFCARGLGDEGFELVRTDIASLEQDTFAFIDAPLPGSLGSITPDGRTFITAHSFAVDRHAILSFDLVEGTWQVIHEGLEICNAHPQLEPARGECIMIQHNRGCEFDADGNWTKLVGEQGATLYLIDTDGGNRRPLPVGKPYTRPCQGHQTWLGRTETILLTTCGGSAEEQRREGIIHTVRDGDENAHTVATGELFAHPNGSLDGRFFVADTYGDARIVVGSVASGHTRLLCSSGASFGNPQYTHPHPYFSPDRRWVVFNSDRTGVPHVWAARVPEGYLEELE